MSQFGLRAALFLLLLPFAAKMEAASETPNRHWQEGEILSRKTIPPSRRHSRKRYVYRIKNGSVQYTAQSDEPLSLLPHTPLEFSIAHRHLFVREANGLEWKSSILKK